MRAFFHEIAVSSQINNRVGLRFEILFANS
jgi:hypothetical protein